MTNQDNTHPPARRDDRPRVIQNPFAAPRTSRRGKAEVAPRPLLPPQDKAAAGRALGLDFRADPDNATAVERLRAEFGIDRQLQQFDPTGQLGMAHRIYCALRGEPEWDTSFTGSYLCHHVHHEVYEFWAEVFGRPATDSTPKAMADRRSFADAFVAAAIG